jgi:hypothetical protein
MEAAKTVKACRRMKVKKAPEVPIMGGPGSLPPLKIQKQQMVGGLGSLPPYKIQPPQQMVGGPGSLPPRFKPQMKVGGPGSLPPELDKNMDEEEKKEPEAESLEVIEAIKGLRTDINKFLSGVESGGVITIHHLRFYVDVVLCFQELLDEAQSAVDDDPAASKIIEEICHTIKMKVRQYFITVFRQTTISTRKLIYQLFTFPNREYTSKIIKLIGQIERDSGNPDDDNDDGGPEIFDSDVIILCQEQRLDGLACYHIDVTVIFSTIIFIDAPM